MASLTGRLKALAPGGRRRKRAFAGWFRIDADNLIRGWARSETAPDLRADVEILVDGQVVGRAVADRPAPELDGEPGGEARYGFAAVIPARFRDGAEHEVEAVAGPGRDVLFSKAARFTASPRARLPSLEVEAVGPGVIRGVLSGGQYPAGIPLELWSGGRRLDGAVTRWRWRGPDREFSLALDPAMFSGLAADTVIAAPGMIEAGLAGAPVFGRPLFTARPAAGRVELRLTPWADFADADGLEARLLDPAGKTVAAAPLLGRRAGLDLPPGGRAVEMSVALALRGRPLGGAAAPVDDGLERLSRNSGFAVWRGGAPVGWEPGPEAKVGRGFFAFGTEQGATGHLASIAVEADGPAVLLRQLLQPPPSGERHGSGALLWRADRDAEIALRLVDEAGVVIETHANRAKAWTWTHLAAPLDCARLQAHEPLFVEIVVTEARGGVRVEIAGARIGGGDAFDDPAPSPRNLALNARLTDWPRGMLLEAGPAREEVAAGWFVQNRKSSSPVRVFGAPIEGGAASSLTVVADDVADFCRLEVALEPGALETDRLSLKFEAVSTSPAAAFTVIDRAFIRVRGQGRDGAPTEAVLGTAARRILVGREPSAFAFDFRLDRPALDAASIKDPQAFLVFDLRRASGLTLSKVVVAEAAEDTDGSGGDLVLEDPAIAAQAGMVRGLEAWTGGEVVSPGLSFAPSVEPAATPRWSWTGAAQGGLEVVVCVHDAAEEALACLHSLCGATSLPHTVRVIDDGSGEDTRRRLLAFVADKPWMRLISTGQNIGYTAAANLGVRGSDAEWVVLLNSDTVVSQGWLEGLMEASASAPDIAFVGPVSNAASYQSIPELKSRAGTWKANDLPPGWTPARMAAWVRENADQAFPRVPLLNGFCTLIRRDAFLALGGFDEAAFPAGYGEENDLCVRAAKAGYGLAVADHVYVHHRKSASFGSKRRTELQKAAGEALARLHPGVDFGELGDRMREVPALVNLRAAARRLYEGEA